MNSFELMVHGEFKSTAIQVTKEEIYNYDSISNSFIGENLIDPHDLASSIKWFFVEWFLFSHEENSNVVHLRLNLSSETSQPAYFHWPISLFDWNYFIRKNSISNSFEWIKFGF